MTRQKHGLVPALPFGTLFSTFSPDIVSGTALEIFDDFFNEALGNKQRFKDLFKSRAEYPKTDAYIEENTLVLAMSVPGLVKEELNIVYEKNTLCVTGEKNSIKEDDKKKYVLKELKHSSFMRKFPFPEGFIDIENLDIKSTLKDGILTVKLPLKPEEKPKQIKVEIK